MTTIREVKVAFKKATDVKEEKREFIKAVIVSYQGNVTVPGREDYCYVKELNLDEAGPFPVLNITTTHTEGLRVLLGWKAKPPFGERQVVGIDNADGAQSGGGVFESPAHGWKHQYVSENNIGIDPVLIYQAAIQILKTTFISGLDVQVGKLVYINNRNTVLFPGQAVDLTTYVPSTASRNVSVLLSLNRLTNTITVTQGIETPVGITPPRPKIPVGHIPSAYITLTTSQSVIDFTTDYLDAREFLKIYGDTNLTATQIGQVLYSVDGTTFTAELPLTNDNGWMVNDDGLLLVV